MYHLHSYALAQARAADLHHQAKRDTLARAARHTRTRQPGHPAPARPAAVRRLLIALGARTSA